MKHVDGEFCKTSEDQNETEHYSTPDLVDKTSENKLHIY